MDGKHEPQRSARFAFKRLRRRIATAKSTTVSTTTSQASQIPSSDCRTSAITATKAMAAPTKSPPTISVKAALERGKPLRRAEIAKSAKTRKRWIARMPASVWPSGCRPTSATVTVTLFAALRRQTTPHPWPTQRQTIQYVRRQTSRQPLTKTYRRPQPMRPLCLGSKNEHARQ